MRHRVKGRKLGRTASHRTATLRALITALFRHKKIKTTVSKAKEARIFAEKVITKAKVDSVANRRYVARHINDREVVKELFEEIMPKIGDRPGGYTRVIKLGTRLGDAAETALVELVDYNLVGSEPKEEKAAPKSAPKAKTESVKSEVVEDAQVIEEVVEEKAAPEVEETEAPKAEESAPEAEEDKKEESK